MNYVHLRSRIRVYHKDAKGVLHSLQDFDLSKTILDAIARGNRSISTEFLTRGDVKRLKQIGLGKDTEVDLVLEFPWDRRSFMAVVAKANDMKLRRQVLVMALDRIRRTRSLSKILAVKGLASCTIRENPYIVPGHAPYENFLDSLLGITDSNSRGGDKLFDEADERVFTSVEKRGVRTVFHGTNHAVMNSILKSGLDPNFRDVGLNEDYFGVDYKTSLEYTKNKTKPKILPWPTRYKLLVFMIIVLKPNVSLDSDEAVTVESNRYQLPLAEITL